MIFYLANSQSNHINRDFQVRQVPSGKETIPMTSEELIAAGLAETGFTYLFPYQRLVITNILEAARSASIPLASPGAEARREADSSETEKDQEVHIDAAPSEPDREVWSGYGKQIVILPTGAGKSLCFQLPARLMNRPTLVVFPILALMADQERCLREQGTRVVLLRGNQSTEERQIIAEVLKTPSNVFIIANPEVLKTVQVRNMLRDARIAHVVIDEAHCVSQWGESFRPAYLELSQILAELKPPLVTAFTATASPSVLEKIRHYIFNDGEAHLVMGNPDRPNISYRVMKTLVKEAALRELLRTLPRPAIVFCGSRSRTEQLARALRYALGSREIYFYHAGLEREEKKTVEDWFFRSSRGILVATCAYGMGVDKSDIRSVIHFDCPNLVEAYLQESGRAGRDGKPATATLLWSPEDEGHRGKLAEYGKTGEQCRRELLLALLMGKEGLGLPPQDNGTGDADTPMIADSGEPACAESSGPVTCTGDENSCDVCLGTARQTWREAPALLNLIRRNPRCFTLTEAASYLSRQDRLDLSREEARQALLILLQRGVLRESKNLLWRKTLVAGVLKESLL